ncbi:hypothetical protein BWR18_03655 [Tateyamaria omphalii]|uniref:Nickel/cobalt efflux system n=2 Tax=Tateyamaria omphalii TaxID=299262 RepID=A0A1P8MS29_9RHOB|nr:hypothetical protein BWR18_03655 [Tateyamaria omphalii]
MSAGIALAVVIYALVPWPSVLFWAAQEQRAFQAAMTGSLRAIRSGDSFAILALCGATAAYGFVHALGPGHGKVLLGGAALASGATMRRMASLTLISSLAQAGSAILLVFVATHMLGWLANDIASWTEDWLAPASAIAIAGIGLLLVGRGCLALREPKSEHRHHHDDHMCGCGHSHGPTASQVQSLRSTKEAAAIVASIAMRPCTGALFLLVIAWRLDIFAVGGLAVVTMGLGTAAFNLIVAASAVAARHLAARPLDSFAMQRFSAILHIAGGTLIALASLALTRTYLDGPFVLP